MDAALTGRLAQLDGAPLRPDEGRLAARRRAEALDAAIRRFTPPDLQRAAVAAIGGYGRSELTPGSDVDLLIVYEPDAEDEAATVAEAILYPLWDAGLAVGHAVRTLGECAFEVRRNVDSLTAMLSARLLDGSELLVQMARKAALDVVRADRARFVALLRQGRGEREARFGRLGRTQDPHLKESLGGLRDLQCLGWLEASLDVSPSPAQRIALDEGLDLILAARAALHRVMAGRDDRLADGQREAVARELGFEPEPGWEGRDVMMRALARAGRRTAAIADELLASADGAEQAAVDPRTEAFVRMVGEGRWTPEALDAFVLLVADGGGDAVIHALDEHSLLDELLPGWSDLAGRPQHDPYHRYPVDVHLTEAATAAARMLAEAEAGAGAEAGAEAEAGARAELGVGRPVTEGCDGCRRSRRWRVRHGCAVRRRPRRSACHSARTRRRNRLRPRFRPGDGSRPRSRCHHHRLPRRAPGPGRPSAR